MDGDLTAIPALFSLSNDRNGCLAEIMLHPCTLINQNFDLRITSFHDKDGPRLFPMSIEIHHFMRNAAYHLNRCHA